MKIKLIAVIGLTLFAVSAFSQTAITPPTTQQQVENIATNLPTVPLTNETFGISLGTAMHGDSTFSADTMFDWNATSLLFARGEIQEGTSVHGIQSITLGFGIYKNVGTSKLYGWMGGRRVFENVATANAPAQWNGVAGLGIAYAPTTGTFKNFSLYAEDRLIVSSASSVSAPPVNEVSTGVRYSF